MPSESVASFLDLARENRLLEPAFVDDLFRQPDVPDSNLAALCDFLQARKVLTAYQAEMIRSGRGYDLSFAGYPVYDDLGPCPGGTAYRVAHPSLRTPLVLRRLRADWLAPADNVSAYIQRAQAACPVVHANLAHLLDAGVHRDEPFVVLDPTDGADLDSLISDIGPMPALLAGEFLRQAARGIAAAHARDLPHGDLRPKHLSAGPLVQSSKLKPDGTPRVRPAATATVKVTEFGLIPLRPPTMAWSSSQAADRAYLPPERMMNAAPTPAGDVFMLGGCLHYLLTGKPPGVGTLTSLRPDVPAPLAALHAEMTAADPAARPPIEVVLARLDALSNGGKPPAPAPVPVAPPPTETSSVMDGGKADVDLVEMSDASGVELADEPPPGSAVPLDSAGANGDPTDLSAVLGTQPPPVTQAGGWDTYVPPPAAPSQPFAVSPSPAEWQPQAFVPHSAGSGRDYEEDDDRTAPGYDPREDGVTTRRAPRKMSAESKKKLWIWLGVGLALQVVAVVIWIAIISGGGSDPDPDPKPRPTPPPVKKPDPNPKKKPGAT